MKNIFSAGFLIETGFSSFYLSFISSAGSRFVIGIRSGRQSHALHMGRDDAVDVHSKGGHIYPHSTGKYIVPTNRDLANILSFACRFPSTNNDSFRVTLFFKLNYQIYEAISTNRKNNPRKIVNPEITTPSRAAPSRYMIFGFFLL